MKVLDNVLVVPPFDCAWLSGEELVFSLPGRGCVSFEARADTDVTVVFKELAGCKHYRTDAEPNYTVVIGSHRNRRLKIAANGATVSDVPWPDVLSPLVFERYWVNVDNGLIVVGKGDPGQGLVYHRWRDAQPNRRVQFVGLSSWDRHVAYRDIQVLPPLPSSSSSSSSCSSSTEQQQQQMSQHWMFGLAGFLESADLSDLQFVVGPERRRLPAHRALLAAASCIDDVDRSPFRGTDVVLLPSTEYQVVRAALEFIYTGRTEIQASLLGQLRDFARQFGFRTLLSQLMVARDTTGATSLTVAAGSSTNRLDVQVLTRLLEAGDLSDLELFLEEYNLSLQLHRLILGACSAPFAKMFTNGMKESNSRARVVVKDVDLDAFMLMIRFMYSGRLDLEEDEDNDAGSLLLSLLALADRYGMPLLQQECHDRLLLDCINKGSAATILLVASSIPGCERLRTACELCCAKHFDYVVAPPATEFKELSVQSVEAILQRSDLVVTSEERVLNAIILWGTKADTWEEAHQMLLAAGSSDQVVSHSREQQICKLLSLVRFPFMSSALLQQLASSVLCRYFPVLEQLIAEASQFCSSSGHDRESLQAPPAHGRLVSLCRSSLRFTRRPSSFKELLYMCDGDCNGVLYYAGTSYGQHPWMNPVLGKQVTLTASSPPSRYTDPRVLVSRKYQATCYAGPCIEAGGKPVSWWKVDLGAEHELMCNYYSVRQDGSTNFMRSWTFQGSWDGKLWTDLRRHKDDQSICRPGQYASWPVQGSGAFVSFRQFRVRLDQPTACSAATPWDLSICYLELYGYLR